MSFFSTLASLIFRKRPVAPAPVKPRPVVAPKPPTPASNVTKTAVRTAAWVAIAVALVGPFEGLALRPYVDRVGTGHPITWCYGATGSDHKIPKMGTTFTKQECDDLLGIDLQKYDAYVRSCIHVPLPPHREAALVSFVYNLGPGALCNGPVGRNINAGNVTAGCNAILAYDHANGQRLAGLTRRRQTERALCLRTD